jgi:hypothetical protein
MVTENTNLPSVPAPRVPVLNAEEGIHGKLIQFKDRQHLLRDGTVVPADRKFAVIGRRKIAQRWEAGIPVDEIVEQSGTPLDVAALNDAVPTDEWETDEVTGEPRPPWSLSFAIYVVDLKDAQIYTCINSTKGQAAAYGTLGNRIEWMSAIRGEPVLPIVTLGEELFSKRFRKYRPEFVIVDWRKPDALSTPLAPISHRIATPTNTTAEDLGDEIPF